MTTSADSSASAAKNGSGTGSPRSYGSADNSSVPKAAMSPLSIGDSDHEGHDGSSSSLKVRGDATLPKAIFLSENRMRLLFGIMGTGTLFPYNAIITCVDYYAELHQDVDDVAGELAASCLTALLVTTIILLPLSTPSVNVDDGSNNREPVVSIGGMPRTICGFVGCTWSCISTIFASPIRRIYIGYILCLLSLLLLAALQQPTMTTLNAASFLVGVADATSQSGLYVFAASFHRPSYTAAVTFGSAIAGLAVGLLRLATRGLFDTTTLSGLNTGVTLLYVISSGVIAMCIAALFVVVRDTKTYKIEDENIHLPEMLAATDDERNDDRGSEDVPTSIEPPNGHAIQMGQTCCCWVSHSSRIQVYLETLRVTWKPTLSAFLNFFITLSLFPGTVSSIESDEIMPFALGDWLPVVLITTFNLADCVGRGVLNIERLGITRLLLTQRVSAATGDSLPVDGVQQGRISLPNIDMMICYHCLSRVVFYPLLAICILPTTPGPVVTSDLLRILIVFIFGFSNGFVNCAAFMVSPTMVKEEKHRDASSLLLLLSIYSGLTIGSYFGLLVDLVLRTIGGDTNK